MFDVIVVGGGIVGVSTAYSLVLSGARVLLIDRIDHGRATDAGAGIISPIAYNGEAHPVHRLLSDAFAYYDDLIDDLSTSNAGDTGFDRCGKLVVAVTQDELEDFQAVKYPVTAQENGEDDERGRLISSEDAKQLFPALADVRGAIHFPDAARVDGRRLTAAIKTRAQRSGLFCRNDSVKRLIIEHKTCIGVVASNEHLESHQVVIAGGAWSPSLGDQLNIHIPVAPQRGQIVHLDTGNTDTSSWPIVTAFHDHYMVPWPDNRIVVGATRETGSGFEPVTTAGGIQEILGEALRVAPGLEDAEFKEVRVGLRPLTSDRMPILGAVPGFDGIYLATGHGPTGLQLGPLTGKLISDLMLDQTMEIELSDFRVDRFS